MKRIFYRKKQSNKFRRKALSINEHNEDKQSKTHVRKTFIYLITPVQEVISPVPKPEVMIKKIVDSENQHESFHFKVKGFFYIKKDSYKFRIDFCHSLAIDILWKEKIFSPNKSATLT